MSYRNPVESLEAPIEKILAGFKEFHSAVTERLGNTIEPWSAEHLARLTDLRGEICKLEYRLSVLKNDTW